jgi:hypothetical protein
MAAYTNNTCFGVWPVGFAAVVVANNPTEAADLLTEAIRQHGALSPQKVEPDSMKLLRDDKPHAVILWDGDY